MGEVRTVRHPDPSYSGRVANVQFAEGTADTDNEGSLAYFRRHGYTIGESAGQNRAIEKDDEPRDNESGDEEPAPPAVESTRPEDDTPSTAAKVAEWRDYAIGVAPDNVNVIAEMTKAQLIEAYGQ